MTYGTEYNAADNQPQSSLLSFLRGGRKQQAGVRSSAGSSGAAATKQHLTSLDSYDCELTAEVNAAALPPSVYCSVGTTSKEGQSASQDEPAEYPASLYLCACAAANCPLAVSNCNLLPGTTSLVCLLSSLLLSRVCAALLRLQQV